MFTTVGKRKGTPRKYGIVTGALNLFWPYSPARVAGFAETNGLLGVLMPNTAESDHVKKQRARINLCRYRDFNRFPKEGDVILSIGGRRFVSWYGWRWHGFESREQAVDAYNKLLFTVWEGAEQNEAFTIEHLFNRWEVLDKPPLPKYLAKRKNKGMLWGRVYRKFQKLFLMRLALERGLDLNLPYTSREWLVKPGATKVDFEKFIPHLDQAGQDLPISRLVKMAVDGGSLGKEPSVLREHRRALYQLARQQSFAEFGDRISTLTLPNFPEPAWGQDKWRKAIEGKSPISFPSGHNASKF